MAQQYIFQMQGLTKAYPGGKKVFENIWLSFYPDAKIGVVGVNGSGKSTLLKIMAGIDKEFSGEAKALDGTKMGYLEQEPHLDESLDVWGNVIAWCDEKKPPLTTITTPAPLAFFGVNTSIVSAVPNFRP